MKRIAILLLTALLATSACTMTPRYHQPDLPVADAWQEGAAEMLEAMPWQHFYKNDVLQQLIDIALQNNRDLRVALLNVDAYRALYGIERANLIPSINAEGALSAQHTPRNASATGSENTTRSYSANLASTAYELDLFGRVRSLKKSSLEDWLATEEASQSAKITLIAEVANAYIRWMADTEVLLRTEETLAAQIQSKKLITASFDNGLASRLDVAQVSQAVASAESNLYQAKRDLEQGKNALLLLLGVKDLPELEHISLLNQDVATVFEPLPTRLSSKVLLQRPDIQEAEHRLKAMNAQIGAARASFFPSINLTGSYGFASNSLNDLFNAGSVGAWQFMPSVSLPIFQGGRNLANLRYTKARKEAAVAEYEKSIQTAFKEVADELANRATLDKQIKAQKDLATAAEDAYNLSYKRYQQGVDRFLTTLDAQRTLYAAETNLIRLRQQKMAHHIQLYKALGGGVLSTHDE